MNSANEMNVEFDSVAKNESFARVIVASFITGQKKENSSICRICGMG